MCTSLADSGLSRCKSTHFSSSLQSLIVGILRGLLHVADLDEVLTNLHSIQGCTLANLVATEPEGQAVLVRDILAHTTYEDVVLASSLQRHGVNEVSGVVRG